MHGNRAQAIVASIFSSELDDVDCSSFLEVVARYVDGEVDRGDAVVADPGLALHRRLCQDCSELYEALLVVATLESSGDFPTAPALWTELQQLAGNPLPTGTGAKAAVAPVPAVDAVRRLESVDRLEGPKNAPPADAEPIRPLDFRAAWQRLALPFSSRQQSVGLALAGVAAAATVAVGTWVVGQSSAKRELEPFVTVASTATHLRTAPLLDGGEVRVLFSPESEEFVVGADRPTEGGGRLVCWLITATGERHLATWAARVQGEAVWVARAEHPLAMYVEIAVTSEPEGNQVAQIALR